MGLKINRWRIIRSLAQLWTHMNAALLIHCLLTYSDTNGSRFNQEVSMLEKDLSIIPFPQTEKMYYKA